MKIIHTGDIHIGSAFQALPREKALKRKGELLEHFRALASYARKEGVIAILIAGDLLDENVVEKDLLREVFHIVDSAKPVQFYYVLGNHDEYASFDYAPDNCHLFPSGKGISCYSLGENVRLYGANTAEFSTRLFSSLAVEERGYNILLLHGDIRGQGREGIPLDRLKNKGIDYLALGHIHKPMENVERLDGRGVYRYCGCLEGRGFDEVGKRGFFLLEIENGRLIKEGFLSFAKREMVEVKADITGLQSYYDLERKVMFSVKPYENDLVKVTLVGKRSPLLKKEEGLLRERILESCFYGKIEDMSTLALDLERIEEDFSEAGEFIKEVGRYEMNEDFSAEVLEVGLKAIYGEEIDL